MGGAAAHSRPLRGEGCRGKDAGHASDGHRLFKKLAKSQVSHPLILLSAPNQHLLQDGTLASTIQSGRQQRS